MTKYLLLVVLGFFTTTALAQSDRGLAKLIAADLAIDEEQAFQVIKLSRPKIS